MKLIIINLFLRIIEGNNPSLYVYLYVPVTQMISLYSTHLFTNCTLPQFIFNCCELGMF